MQQIGEDCLIKLNQCITKSIKDDEKQHRKEKIGDIFKKIGIGIGILILSAIVALPIILFFTGHWFIADLLVFLLVTFIIGIVDGFSDQ